MLVLLGLVACLVTFRVALSAIFVLFDPDEALSMNVARTLLEGGLPYVDCYANRGLLLYVLYAIPLAFSGPYAYASVHWTCVAIMAASNVTLASAVGRSVGRARGAVALAVLLVLATLWEPSDDTWALNSDLLMGMVADLGLAALLLGAERPSASAARVAQYAFVGSALGAAFLVKQSGVTFAIVPLACILLYDRQRCTAKVCVYSMFYLTPFLLAVVIYLRAGEWHRFWYGFYAYNAQYIHEGFGVSRHVAWLARVYGVIGAIAVGGVVMLCFEGRVRTSLVLVLWLGAASVATLIPGRLWDNYLWAMHGGVAVAAGCGVGSLATWLVRGKTWVRILACALGVLLASCAGQRLWRSIAKTRVRLARIETRGDIHVGGVRLPRVLRRDVVAAVRRYTSENDYIYVTGYAPEIYILSRRRYATRHVVSNYVEGYFPGSRRAPVINPVFLEELVEDLRRTRPRVVIDACRLGYLCDRRSTLIRALRPFLAAQYRQVGAGIYVGASSRGR